MTHLPLYYRFVMKPSNGEVLLSHNGEAHPTEVRTHGALALEANEPGLVHGYAYRIGGGWRIHDYEHKPLTDPFVKAQVGRALRREEGLPDSQTVAQDPSGADFEHFHYGQPLRA